MRGRKIAIGALLAFGTLFWTLFGVGLWVQRQALDTDHWVIVRPDQLDTANVAFEAAVWILLALALVTFGSAIFLSRDRRRTILTIGGCLIFAGIALVALRRLGERAVVEALADAPNAHAVTDDVWDIATSLMVDAARGSMLFGAFVVSGAWVAGPGRRATALRRALSPSLRERPGLRRGSLGVLP